MIRTIFLAVAMAALAMLAPAAARDEPRVVIGLYDGDLASSSLKAAEPALNHLGLLLEPHSTAEKLPGLAGRTDVRGVLIWLDGGALADASGFTPWLRSVTQSGLPAVMMGATPLSEDRFGMFLALGLIYARDDRPYTYDLRVIDKDAEITDFERRYDNVFPPVDLVRPLDAGLSQAVLTLQRRGDVTDRTVPLVITPKGAYAAPGYARWLSPGGTLARWFIDPVRWFRRAFRLGALPAPDPTTLNARRILAPAFIAGRPEDGPAADALAHEISSSYPGVSAVLTPAREGRVVAVPRGGGSCGNHAAVFLLGFDGAKAALDEGETPYRISRYAPLFEVCAGEEGLARLGAQSILEHAAGEPLIAAPPPMLDDIDAGFAEARLEIVGDKTWLVHDRHGLQTLRFDEAAALRVDWQKSKGVLGAGRIETQLYVSLDPAVETPLVALTDAPYSPPQIAVLVESRWMVSAMERDWSQLSADVQGVGPGDMTWSAPPGSQWDIRLTTGNHQMHRYAARADAQGRLAFSLPALAAAGGTLEMLRDDISGPGP